MFTDDAITQCVTVSVTSVSSVSGNDESCLSFRLLPATSMDGLTLYPDEASVCVVPTDGKYRVQSTTKQVDSRSIHTYLHVTKIHDISNI